MTKLYFLSADVIFNDPDTNERCLYKFNDFIEADFEGKKGSEAHPTLIQAIKDKKTFPLPSRCEIIINNFFKC